MAAQLRNEGNAVTMKRGGLGELRVETEGRDLYDGNRLMYSTPGRIVDQVRRRLSESG